MSEEGMVKGSMNAVDFIFLPGSEQKLLLIKTGLGGSAYGYHGKYFIIAKCFQCLGYNVLCCSTPMELGDRESFETAISIAKKQMGDQFSNDYMGVSRGAYQGILYGNSIPQIRSLLLINSPMALNFSKQVSALRSADKRYVLVIGTEDPSFQFWPFLRKIENPNLELTEATGSDHHFKGMDKEFFGIPVKVFLSEQ